MIQRASANVNTHFPESSSIIAMGNGKIQTTMKGTSTCPIAKICREVAKKRRLVYTPESYTTAKCSFCCNKNNFTTSILLLRSDKEKGPQINSAGKTYIPKIHGLRQCKHCARTWNRDKNASRNIFNSFSSLLTTGKRAEYLQRCDSVSSGVYSASVKSGISQSDSHDQNLRLDSCFLN